MRAYTSLEDVVERDIQKRSIGEKKAKLERGKDVVSIGGHIIPLDEIVRVLTVQSTIEGFKDDKTQIKIMTRELRKMVANKSNHALMDLEISMRMIEKCKELRASLRETKKNRKSRREYTEIQEGYEKIKKAKFITKELETELGMSYSVFDTLTFEEIQPILGLYYTTNEGMG